MRIIRCFVLTLAIGALMAPAHAADIQTGIHDMPWGSHASRHDHLTRVRESGPVSYYVNTNMIYSVAERSVPGVVYGFYKDQLFAVYIRLAAPDQFYHMEKRFSAEYGEPEKTVARGGDMTVYRWKQNQVKIKLKLNEPEAEMKVGIYYVPLSAQLNEAQAEEAPEGVFSPAPSETGKPVRSTPLL